MKRWERYFFHETLRVFLFVLVMFYSLYVLIDFASHTGSFHNNRIQVGWGQIAYYYTFEFISKAEILLPFALLIATVRTLTNFNQNQELMALQAAGISLRRLMVPFLTLGLICTSLLYVNTEWLLPAALKKMRVTESKSHRSKSGAVQSLTLADETVLLYHLYDREHQQFQDVYWIRSFQDIWHMKTLNVHSEATFADHLTRQDNLLEMTASYPNIHLPDLKFHEQRLEATITTPEELPLTALFSKLSSNPAMTEKEAQQATYFYRKLLLPWFCLAVILAVTPSCCRVTRQLPVYAIFAVSLFGLVALYLTLNAVTVMAMRQVISPALALLPIFLLLLIPTALWVRSIGLKGHVS